MKKALIIGIDYYTELRSLHGCVNDAHSVKAALERNGDGSLNFETELHTATGPGDEVTKGQLKTRIRVLFENDVLETVILYFAGHGHQEAAGGYILGSDATTLDDGLALSEVLTYANQSKARNRIILLDSCHSGAAGTNTHNSRISDIAEGVTILTASTAEQYATEQEGQGVFTRLLVDALGGAASNLLGDISPGSIYAHIDQALGAGDQRPVFKTNVKRFVSLRRVQPPIPLDDLRRLPSLFVRPGDEFALDPTHEPDSESPDVANVDKFRCLQRMNRVNLVVPVGAPHMYHAAMERKHCKLTVLGEHYWRLVSTGKI